MKVFKIILSVLLTAAALAMVVFAGSLLLSAIPREKDAPAVLNTDQLFPEEAAEAEPPAQAETAPEPETAEEPAGEAPPAETEEPVQEEAPPQEEPEPQAPAEEDPHTARARAYLAAMTLEEKIWQLFITTPESLTGVTLATRAGETTQKALEAMPVGGICYFAANLEDREQTIEMLANTQSYAKTPLFLAVDEEGGLVSRVGSNEAMGTTCFDAAAKYGEDADMAQVYNVGKTMAQELTQLGFNLNFAPVADVVTNPNNMEIGNRAYSEDPQVAGALVSAMVEGLQRGGMAACLKHFPGHGSTEVDSHQDKSLSNRTLEELRQTEWIPFQAGIGEDAAFVMVSHLTNENFSGLPSSLSAETMGYLRGELGFDGLVITDSLQMGAIVNYYTSAQAAVMALEAGADMLLMPNDLQTAYDGIQAALEAGTLTEARIDESVLRILTVKYRFQIMS